MAHVETGSIGLGRAFKDAGELIVFDGPGNPLVQVEDAVTLGRDRMEVLDGAGGPLASLVKWVVVFKTRVTVELHGEELSTRGQQLGPASSRCRRIGPPLPDAVIASRVCRIWRRGPRLGEIAASRDSVGG